MTHYLQIEVDGEDARYKIFGTHTESCAVWYTCLDCIDVPSPFSDETSEEFVDDDEREMYSERHRWIEGRWMARSDHCGGFQALSRDDSLLYELGTGVWEVYVDYIGEGGWIIGKENDE